MLLRSVICQLCATAVLVNGVTVYHAVKYDSKDGSELGARKSTVKAEVGKGGVDIVRVNDIAVSEVQNFMEGIGGSGAVLVGDKKGSRHQRKVMNKIQKHLLENAVEVPLYFTNEGEEAYEELTILPEPQEGNGLFSDRLVINIVPKQQPSSTLSAPVQSQVPFYVTSFESSTPNAETIVVTGTYDSTTAFPSAPLTGAQNSGVGISASLVRVLSKMYGTKMADPGVNVVVMLGVKGYKNTFPTAKRWLQMLGGDQVKRVAYSLCLESFEDSMNDIKEVVLTESLRSEAETHKEAAFVAAMKKIGEEMQIGVKTAQHYVDYSSSEVGLEANHFAHKQISAGSLVALSGDSGPNTHLAVQKLTSFIVSSIVLYGSGAALPTTPSLVPSLTIIEAALSTPIPSPTHLQQTSLRPFFSSFKGFKEDSITTDDLFYMDPPLEVSVHVSKGTAYELCFTVAIAAYLLVLYKIMGSK
eukprot:TRINITY_DN21809_c0_g1_i2.p1 TRINITY_DN21809_c0_g1~~TRINITY_DN21809_c0_g1_i2.p1  ORF type:complete len:471 (+),score=101.75 TRINITY_DN21809_c0_g1_i2:40-1452(+)